MLKPLELDILLPKIKLAIEYNGEYWHQHKKRRDAFKKLLCKKKGYLLIAIKEKDWQDDRQSCENIIKNEISLRLAFLLNR